MRSTTAASSTSLRLLIIYCPRDYAYKEEIEKYLAPLTRSGTLSTWSTDSIAPGGIISDQFAEAVEHADGALLLFSAELLDDPCIQGRQMPLLLRAQRESGLRLIPILLRPCLWEMEGALGQLQPLPTDRVPLWSRPKPQRDQALVDLAQALAKLPPRPMPASIPLAPTLVHPDSPYNRIGYLPRLELESQALRLLATPGQPAVVWAPERFGKSWLLRRLLDHIQDEDGDDTRCTLIHLGQLLSKCKDRESFYRGFAERMVDALDADSEYGTQWARWVADAWQQIGVPMRRLKWLAQHCLLPRCPRRLVVALDAADEAIGSPWQDEFYGMLRGWAEAAHTTEFARLRIILAVSTAPRLLIVNLRQSPFNLTQPLSISPLNNRLLAELAKMHWINLSSDAVEYLRVQLGGHPYLSRLCLYVASRDRTTPNALLDPAHPTNSLLFSPFLDSYRQRLNAEPELLETLRGVVNNSRGLSPKHIDRLVQAGLLLREGISIRLFCPLFERLL